MLAARSCRLGRVSSATDNPPLHHCSRGKHCPSLVAIRTIARPAEPCSRHRTVLTVRDAPHVAAYTGSLSIRAAPSAHRTKLWARLPPAPSHSDAALPAGPTSRPSSQRPPRRTPWGAACPRGSSATSGPICAVAFSLMDSHEPGVSTPVENVTDVAVENVTLRRQVTSL